jgi:4-amino-4-deoxy-L-arabinose transferase-like glycosyltransferase
MASAVSEPPSDESREPGPLLYRRPAAHSWGVIGIYLGLALLLTWVYSQGSSDLTSASVALGLIVVVLVYLARYLSTRYRIDDTWLIAWRLFGSRRVRLSRVRKIQRVSLRSLGPVGFLGTWGWRGRVWSSIVGTFDTVHTVSDGLLVTGGGVPLFISPVDPDDFQRELSRRARSVNGGWEPDLTPV